MDHESLAPFPVLCIVTDSSEYILFSSMTLLIVNIFLNSLTAVVLFLTLVTNSSHGWDNNSLPLPVSQYGADQTRSLFWEGLGPAGATVTAITYHPTMSGLVYMGTQENGLYLSINGGTTWNTAYPDSGWITFILVDPFDPSIVLVGAATRLSGTGSLRRSTDYGLTWNAAFEGHTIDDSAFDPSQPGIVYMSTAGAPDKRSNAYFYRSTDHGESWTLMNPGGTHGSGLFVWMFTDHLISPKNGDILAYTEWANGMGYSEGHVCLSTDGGATWEFNDTGLYDNHTWDMAWIFPGVAAAGTKNGLYIHLDGGNRWYRVPNEVAGLNCYILSPGPENNIWYLVETDYDTWEEPDVIHRSTTWGLSWSQLPLISGSREINTVAADPDAAPGAETILAGVYEAGVFASTDLGQTWEIRNDGLPPTSCLSLDYGPPGSGLLYAGADGLFLVGLYRSRDLGTTWELANEGITGGRIDNICTHPTDDQIVFASANGLYRSTNQGDSWIRLINGLLEYAHIYCLEINPDNTDIIFAGTDEGLFKSTDGGDTWSYAGADMTDGYIRDIAMDLLNPLHMFAACYADGIYESEDGAESWNLVLKEDLWNDFVSIAVAPGGGRVYAGMLWSENLHLSTDGGDNWEVALNESALDIIIPEDYPHGVAIGSDQTGVWASLDGGDTWFSLEGLEGEEVNDLALPPPGGGFLSTATTAGIQRLTSR
jgi:photosystem II stability/assembly factor-like uncharacterized protein